MFNRPGITQLRDEAIGDILVGTGLPTLLRRSPLRAMGYALAGLAYGTYGYLDWIARQSVPFTSTGVFLEAWAALVGIFREPATAATGTAGFVGTVGAPVPVNTLLRRSDGAGYVTLGAAMLAGNGTATVAVAATGTGSAYTLTDDTPLTLAAPLAGVQSGAVGQPVTAAADPELDGSLRTRMMLRWAEPPQGGDLADYKGWALAVPGVTRAWVNPRGAGAGTVVIYTMWDLAEAAFAGFPQGTDGTAVEELREAVTATGDQLLVAEVIYPLRGATALVWSVAATPYPVAFTIQTPVAVPAATQAAAALALRAVFLASADPLGGSLQTGPFDAALASALGSASFSLVSPSVPVAAPLGQLPTLGVITWQVGNA